MEVKVKVDADQAIKDLAASAKAYKAGLKGNMRQALNLLRGSILDNLRGGAGLNVKTGALIQSVRDYVIENSDESITGTIGPEGVPYGRIQELGGTIVPKNKKALAIPTLENQRPDGLPIITTQDLMSGLIPSFINKGVIFGLMAGKGRGRTGKGTAEAKALFILRQSVILPAHHYLSMAVDSQRDAIMENFGLFIAAVLPVSKG
jgi:hypothetical protein